MRYILGFFILILLPFLFNAFPETREIISEGTYNMGEEEGILLLEKEYGVHQEIMSLAMLP